MYRYRLRMQYAADGFLYGTPAAVPQIGMIASSDRLKKTNRLCILIACISASVKIAVLTLIFEKQAMVKYPHFS